MGWRNRPKFINQCPSNIDYVLFIDENGSDDLKDIKKNPFKYTNQSEFLTITGIVVHRDNLAIAKTELMRLKTKYWTDGLCSYKSKIKRVCFHSVDIRKKQGPFNPRKIAYYDFLKELSEVMQFIPFTVFSSSINKVKHCEQYVYPNHPYHLCLNFIAERFAKYYLKPHDTAIIVFEGIGKQHDRFTLDHMKLLLERGTSFVQAGYFQKIKGIYFNRKWSCLDNDLKSYFGLEIADLCSYPIHKFVKYDNKDLAFTSVESHLYNYPQYLGYGIKTFPQ